MAASRTPGVSVFFRDYADPILRAQGFTKKGRTYRRRGGNGDIAFVNFQASSGAHPEAYVFYVNLAVAPLPWIAWLRRQWGDAETFEPTAGYGLYADRLRSNRFWETWTIDSDEAGHSVGRRLAEMLPPRLEELVSLLDRREFLRRVREGPELPRSGIDVEIIMLLDDGPLEQLEPLLDDMEESRGAGPEFAEWARSWIQTRRAT